MCKIYTVLPCLSEEALNMRRELYFSVLLLLLAVLTAMFSFWSDQSKARLDAANGSVSEIFSAYAENDLEALAESLAAVCDEKADSERDVLVAAALFERSLASLPMEKNTKRSLYRELEDLRAYFCGELSGYYDASWIGQAARDGVGSIGDHLPERDTDEHTSDEAFAPIFTPKGKESAMRYAQKLLALPIKLREASSVRGGGSYVFYCANAYAVINMYDMRCTELLYAPTRMGEPVITRDEADAAARKYLYSFVGTTSSSRAQLSRYNECAGIAYLTYELQSGSRITLGVAMSSGKLLMLSEK